MTKKARVTKEKQFFRKKGKKTKPKKRATGLNRNAKKGSKLVSTPFFETSTFTAVEKVDEGAAKSLVSVGLDDRTSNFFEESFVLPEPDDTFGFLFFD